MTCSTHSINWYDIDDINVVRKFHSISWSRTVASRSNNTDPGNKTKIVESALIVSSETCKEVLTQLVSTSNKRPSSGEMKIDLKRVFYHNKNSPNQEVQLLKKDSSLQEHTGTRHHKKEMGHQLIQQAFNRWRAILDTEGTKICSEFFQGASYQVHCSY